MKKSLITLLCLLTSFSLSASFPSEISTKILYWMHQGQIERAITTYVDYATSNDVDDFELLQEASLILLEEGIENEDPEIQLMCMYGAGIAATPRLIPILAKGIQSKELKIQLAALHFLGRLQDDEADLLIHDCLSSPFLLARLEAIFLLAEKHDPEVIEQLQSLFYKVPDKVKILFAEIVSSIKTQSAVKMLQQLLNDPDQIVRLATILEIGESQRDELILQIRRIGTLPHTADMEATAFTLGKLKDTASKELLERLSRHVNPQVKLAALNALYQIGEEDAFQHITTAALEYNYFAINLLSQEETLALDTLEKLAQSEDPICKLNASLALLKAGNPDALTFLKGFLLTKEGREVGLVRQFSLGKSLSYWKTIPSAKEKVKLFPQLASDTSRFHRQILIHALELPEEDFIKFAQEIFAANQSELIAPIVELLLNQGGEKALSLLHEMREKAGAPLIRSYCNLALYTLTHEKEYEDTLVKWVEDGKNHALIRFEDKKEEEESKTSRYELNPEEASRLLISSIEALGSSHRKKGVQAILRAIAFGHPKNRYALAGLLIRTAE